MCDYTLTLKPKQSHLYNRNLPRTTTLKLSIQYLLYNGPLYSGHHLNVVIGNPKLAYNDQINCQHRQKLTFYDI